ncbi:hypothetical protein KRR23_14095 [Pseudomonas sp. CVAP|uniref:hypothetical protein n=1 Tax=Pseudomonas sp. CVAP\|nr:hypothetical protein [Pseudomonas sp. CVAP\
MSFRLRLLKRLEWLFVSKRALESLPIPPKLAWIAVTVTILYRSDPGFPRRMKFTAVDWHKGCKARIRIIWNGFQWTAPSVNDDRLAEQVMGNFGASGMDVWF